MSSRRSLKTQRMTVRRTWSTRWRCQRRWTRISSHSVKGKRSSSRTWRRICRSSGSSCWAVWLLRVTLSTISIARGSRYRTCNSWCLKWTARVFPRAGTPGAWTCSGGWSLTTMCPWAISNLRMWSRSRFELSTTMTSSCTGSTRQTSRSTTSPTRRPLTK